MMNIISMIIGSIIITMIPPPYSYDVNSSIICQSTEVTQIDDLEEIFRVSAEQGWVVFENDSIWVISSRSGTYSDAEPLNVVVYQYDGSLHKIGNYDDIRGDKLPAHILRVVEDNSEVRVKDYQKISCDNVPYGIKCVSNDTLRLIYVSEENIRKDMSCVVIAHEIYGLTRVMLPYLKITLYQVNNQGSEIYELGNEIIHTSNLQNITCILSKDKTHVELWTEYISAGARYYYYHMSVYSATLYDKIKCIKKP